MVGGSFRWKHLVGGSRSTVFVVSSSTMDPGMLGWDYSKRFCSDFAFSVLQRLYSVGHLVSTLLCSSTSVVNQFGDKMVTDGNYTQIEPLN